MKNLIHFDWNDRKYLKTLVKDEETIVAAFSEFGREIPVADDGFGPVWYYQNDDHFRCVVRADSFESALDAVYDVMPTVAEEDLHEAYGFDDRAEYDALVASIQSGESDEFPELAECFHFQSNASDTGIVFAGYCENLAEIDPNGFEELQISILVESDDDA